MEAKLANNKCAKIIDFVFFLKKNVKMKMKSTKMKLSMILREMRSNPRIKRETEIEIDESEGNGEDEHGTDESMKKIEDGIVKAH